MTRAKSMLYVSGRYSLHEKDDSSLELSLYERIKKKIFSQREKAEDENKSSDIPGDKILVNGSLFGLLLPSVVDVYEKDALRSKELIALDEMNLITRDEADNIIKETQTKNTSVKMRLQDFANAASPLYETAQVITTPVIPQNRASPTSSALHNLFYNERDTQQYAIIPMIHDEAMLQKIKNAVDCVDEILAQYADLSESQVSDEEFYDALTGVTGNDKRVFTAADFGAIAHAASESVITGAKMIIPPQIDSLLTPAQSKKVIQSALAFAECFSKTQLGEAARRAVKSGWFKTEYGFRTRIAHPDDCGFFIDGIIDLLFEESESNNCVTIVDFKTDKIIAPEKHIPQLACYYRAATAIRKKTARVWIYYLRTGEACDVTDAVRLTDKMFDSHIAHIDEVLV
jgi:ATP-dependent helicase/nuclease subunit A